MMILAAKLAEHGIRLRSYDLGSSKILCPQCSHTRRKKNDPCLSVSVTEDGVVWQCHNCDWSGGVRDGEPEPRRQTRASRPAKSAPPTIEVGTLSQQAIDYLAKRGISVETARAAGVGWGRHWFPQAQGEADCLIFPYRNLKRQVVNAKYRSLDKAFSQVKDGEKLLWLLDQVDIEHGDAMVICEGEIDALSLLEAGVLNVVSVPDGAPKQVKDGAVDPAEDRKFSFVWASKEVLDQYQKIVLATDADEPGQALAEELARRIGKEKCYRVEWPDGCKDANDVLLKHGKEELATIIDRAQPYPIAALQDTSAFSDAVHRMYQQGRGRGLSTGWASVSEIYTVAPGQLTVLTGVPNCGKSEWLDALTVNLAEAHGWRFAVASFENPPEEHVAKLVEKHLGVPFWDGPTPRMTETQLREGEAWVRDHFWLIRADDEAPTIDLILDSAHAAVLRHGVRGLVIDPYNEIEHRRPPAMSETEYVSQLLGRVKRFAQNHNCHVWFVAHPAKLYRDKGKLPVPSLYDISGSANWVNKADVGIVVHRQLREEGGKTEIHVRKMRFKWVGKIGVATLAYDVATGTYHEPDGSARMSFGEAAE